MGAPPAELEVEEPEAAGLAVQPEPAAPARGCGAELAIPASARPRVLPCGLPVPPRVFVFSVSSALGPGRFSRVKLVAVSPRFVVENATARRILIRPVDPTGKPHPYSYLLVHHPSIFFWLHLSSWECYWG